MLVLSRKKGESIIINDNIELTVLSVEGDTVKIGISAPRNVDIYRKEIYEIIEQSNRDAAFNPKMLEQWLGERTIETEENK